MSVRAWGGAAVGNLWKLVEALRREKSLKLLGLSWKQVEARCPVETEGNVGKARKSAQSHESFLEKRGKLRGVFLNCGRTPKVVKKSGSVEQGVETRKIVKNPLKTCGSRQNLVEAR